MPMNRTRAARVGAAAVVVALATGVGAPAASAQTAAPATSPMVITTFAGNGHAGFSGDGDRATHASLTYPTGVVEDVAGNVYIADTLNFRVRKVNTAGIISLVAGTGVAGFSGDGHKAVKAKLSSPSSPALDSAGNLYIADTGNNRIRKVSTAGIITTVVGIGSCGRKGDGGLATSAQLCQPSAVAIDNLGVMYIADAGNNEIRKVTPGGIISTFAGTGAFGSTGDGGAAKNARLASPSGVAVDSLRDVFIADTANSEIREVNPAGTIHTFAGTGSAGFGGDAGPASQAKLNHASGVGVDALGNVYIADSLNFRIRVVIPAGVIYTYAGNGSPGFSGDGGPATSARMDPPQGDLAVDANNVFFADTANERVRRIQGGPPPNISESADAILLPLSVILLIGGAYLVVRRRRRLGVTVA